MNKQDAALDRRRLTTTKGGHTCNPTLAATPSRVNRPIAPIGISSLMTYSTNSTEKRFCSIAGPVRDA
jgi:hypothetical protein